MVLQDNREYCNDQSKDGCELDIYRDPKKRSHFILQLTKKDRSDKGLRVYLDDFPSWSQSEESKSFEKELLDSLLRSPLKMTGDSISI
jgi:hypothetical protein